MFYVINRNDSKGFYKEAMNAATDAPPNNKESPTAFWGRLAVTAADKQTNASTPNIAPPIYQKIDPALTNGSRLSSL